MSRIHRAVEKAEREGLLSSWTRTDDERARRATVVADRAAHATAVEELPLPLARPPVSAREERVWETPRTTDAPLSPLFVAATEPGSSAAEQYRLLRTRLEGQGSTRPTQVLVVTSPRIGEGKTTTSANLALTMAQEFHHRVALVEADLRRPTLAAQFGVQAEPGLVDVLIGAAPLEDALVPVPGQHLFLLPAGAAAARSSELLASSMMQRVMDALRARFDRIVIDTPPTTLADTHVLARQADGVLIVVRAGVTPRPAVERAIAAVDRQRLIGIVLNEVDETTEGYAYPGVRLRSPGE
jgi:protein-tyrosine kinase